MSPGDYDVFGLVLGVIVAALVITAGLGVLIGAWLW